MAVVPPGLTPGTPKERFEYELLYEKSYDNPSGTVDLPSVELESDERAEIVLAEVEWPSGQPEGKLIPVIDGDLFAGGSQIVCRVGYNSTILPPNQEQILLTKDREVFVFGEPRTSDGLKNTTLKVVRKMAARIVTDGSVTGTVTVRYWGYKYKGEESLRRAYPSTVSIPPSIYDATTGRSVTVPPKTVYVSFDTWDQLPGGQKQSKPIINPLIRYAINANDTTPNTPYDFRYETGNVPVEDQNLYFDLTPERQRGVIIITHFGIRAAANLKGWGVNVNGEVRPDKDYVKATTSYNPYHFGHVSPFLPGSVITAVDFGGSTATSTPIDLWYPLRKLPYPIIVWREIGRVQIIDNGTAVSAGSVTVAIKAIQVIE